MDIKHFLYVTFKEIHETVRGLPRDGIKIGWYLNGDGTTEVYLKMLSKIFHQVSVKQNRSCLGGVLGHMISDVHGNYIDNFRFLTL